jgi:hypothetical protein
MMDKQKQIDEMARILTLCPRNTCVGCGMECIDYRMAKAIYNADYRKIPEGAVVLTKERYIEMLDEIKVSQGKLLEMLKTVEKKTAEKFAERLKEKMHKGKALHATLLGKEYVQRIIREVVDEICKEITEGKSCEG